MNFWILNAMSVFLLCMFLSGIIIPQILMIATRKKLYDELDERKIHKVVVPRLGGSVFEPVIFFSTLLILGVNLFLGNDDILSVSRDDLQTLLFGYCGMVILYLVGIADDLIGIRYGAKFIFQTICALMLISGNLYIDNFHGILGIGEIPDILAVPVTVLAVVFIVNAINMIDGIDGLASGICCVAFLLYALVFFHYQQYIYGMLSFASLGVLLPFFYYNVFGKAEKGRKIFMGDTGSLTIGFLICLMGIRLLKCIGNGECNHTNPFIVAFSPLFIPCFDVIRVYFHRVWNGKNPFLPDKNHIHHKLLAIGMKQKTVMISIITACIVISKCNMALSPFVNANWLLLGNATLYMFFNIWLTHRIKRNNKGILTDRFRQIQTDSNR